MRRSLQVAFVMCLAPAIVAAQSAAPVADAARRGQIETVRTLLKQGSDVSAALGDGMSALHWAGERGDLAMAEMLIYGGANVEAVTRIGAYAAAPGGEGGQRTRRAARSSRRAPTPTRNRRTAASPPSTSRPAPAAWTPSRRSSTRAWT